MYKTKICFFFLLKETMTEMNFGYMGGLLTCYAISKNPVYKAKAIEIGEKLLQGTQETVVLETVFNIRFLIFE